MRRIRLPVYITCALWLLLSFIPAVPVKAQGLTTVPSGFRLIDSAPGVQLYRKDYQNGRPDFVQVVNLRLGASVKVLHGDVTAKREGRGAYGGADPRLTSRSIKDYWAEIKNTFRSAFCVTNGQFFYMPEYPTRLPFPLKKDGEIISDGYGLKEYPGLKLMLELWDDHADIRDLSSDSLYSSSAPDIIAGLAENANKRAKYSVGRTFMGIDDADGDRTFETVLVFNTLSAKQSDAAEVLRKFGADKVMMLDGGGSTQLLCGKESLITSERLIPQAIAVVAAQDASAPELLPTPVMAEVVPTPAPTPDAVVARASGIAGGYISHTSLGGSANSGPEAEVVASKTQFIPLVQTYQAGAFAEAPSDDAASPGSQDLLVDPDQSILAESGAGRDQLDLSGALLIPITILPFAGAFFLAVNKIQRRY